MDGATVTRQKRKFPVFSISRRFGVTAKKRNFRKRKLVAMPTSIENSKIKVQIVHLQP